MATWNVFRYLADLFHFASKFILIRAIHVNSSAEGVSLVSQAAYFVVFIARYAPQPKVLINLSAWHNAWLIVGKLSLILCSTYTIFLMTKVYARTREMQAATRTAWISYSLALLLSPFVMLIARSKRSWTFAEWSWIFSIMLESVAILPQLLLLRQTRVPTVLDSYYLATLGLYRFFYLLNWLVHGITESSWDVISIIFGLIQTLFYADFAWVYLTRQRVKLRGGAVVDSDDFRNGLLVKRFFGRREEQARGDFEDHEEHTDSTDRPATNRWGPRGISVSADEGVYESQSSGDAMHGLTDPAAFEDEDSDDDAGKTLQRNNARASSSTPDSDATATNLENVNHDHEDVAKQVGNGSEWRSKT